MLQMHQYRYYYVFCCRNGGWQLPCFWPFLEIWKLITIMQCRYDMLWVDGDCSIIYQIQLLKSNYHSFDQFLEKAEILPRSLHPELWFVCLDNLNTNKTQYCKWQYSSLNWSNIFQTLFLFFSCCSLFELNHLFDFNSQFFFLYNYRSELDGKIVWHEDGRSWFWHPLGPKKKKSMLGSCY